MIIDNPDIIKDLSIASISLLIIFFMGKIMIENTFKQLEILNDNIKESNEKFRLFIEDTFKDNNKTIDRLCDLFEEHTRSKDESIKLLKEQQKLLETLISNNSSNNRGIVYWK